MFVVYADAHGGVTELFQMPWRLSGCPPGREPAFLTGSTLRPVLSAAGQAGLRSLPPDIVALIDRLKQQHGI